MYYILQQKLDSEVVSETSLENILGEVVCVVVMSLVSVANLPEFDASLSCLWILGPLCSHFSSKIVPSHVKEG